jgi:hypothetical protein
MATLLLPKEWINLVATGAGVSGDALVGRPESYNAIGDVRIYAGGRSRAITSSGEDGKYTFQLRYIPRTTVDTLHSWMKQLVQCRDSKGRKLLGVYFALPIEEVSADHFCRTDINLATGAWHATIELRLVTATEGV